MEYFRPEVGKTDVQAKKFRKRSTLCDHVTCPRRGHVKIDVCFYCEYLDGVDLDAEIPYIRCSPPGTESMDGISYWDMDEWQRGRAKART